MKIFGYHSVAEALKEKNSLVKIITAKNPSARIKALLKVAREKNIRIQYVEKKHLDKMFPGHRGIVALLSDIEYVPLEKMLEESFEKSVTPFFVFLLQISNVGNVGNIIRSAECLGASGIILSDIGSPNITGDLIRLSAGAALRLPIHRATSPKETFYTLQAYEVEILGTYPDGKEKLNKLSLKNTPHCWIFGEEQKGIPPKYSKFIPRKISIEQAGNLNSLNVSSAAAICMYKSLTELLP